MDKDLDAQATEDQGGENLSTTAILEREFDKLETEQPAEPEKKKETEEPAQKQDDDEQEKEVAPEKEGEPEAKEDHPTEPRQNPYAAWKKEAQAELVKLPENVQRMIQDREAQFHRGIQGYKEDALAGREMKAAIRPFEQYLTHLGAKASDVIPMLLQAEMMLRTGTPEHKIQMMQQLARDYGINLQQLAEIPFNEVEYQLRQQNAAQQRQISQLSQSQQIAEEATINQTIDEFANGKEYFEELRGTMADLLDRGMAKNLEDAYAKALRLNDDVFAKYQAKQQENAERQKLEQADKAAKQARNSAVSVRGSPGGTTKGAEPKTTEEAVRQAFANLGL